MLNINLHLGAHKTATTYIQNILNTNQRLLNDNEIYFSTPTQLRNERWFESILTKDGIDDIHGDNTEENTIPTSGLWIISEENILGIPYDFMTSNEIYPRASKRLHNLKKLISDKDITIYFSIRCYHSYYSSCYLEVVRNNGYLDFSNFYDKSRFKHNTWLSVIDVLTKIFPENNIVLWCYEDFIKLENIILKKLTGLADNELVIDDSAALKRTSLSSKALDRLKKMSSKKQYPVTSEQIETLNLELPRTPETPSFMPFSEAEITLFKKRYKNDIREIKEIYPKITFLSPR